MTENTKEKKDVVQELLDKSKPFLANMGMGTIMGGCSGYATKKVGKALALLGGLVFIGLQMGVSYGYIEGVNWLKFKDDCVKTLDVNKDGTVNELDAKELWKKFKAILTTQLPGAGGFSVGFLYGVRYG